MKSQGNSDAENQIGKIKLELQAMKPSKEELNYALAFAIHRINYRKPRAKELSPYEIVFVQNLSEYEIN